MKKLFLCTLFALMLPILLLGANGYVEGQIVDDKTGEPLSAANVILEGTTIGSVSDVEGYYTIIDVPEGDYTVSIQFIGYETVSKKVKVVARKKVKVNFRLKSVALGMSALEVFASRATRNTPVAYSNIEKENLEFRLGSQDIPMVLNLTPSVYATQQGGGAGDARVNVRGFNQKNVAVMVNGVPINDMENGWIYWSNWDGVADATSSIQMQRGLSAVNLATPSIGGTMNIITDPAAIERGGKFRQEYGSGTFLKTTATYHSGLINDKLAFGGTVVRKVGNGVIDKTWTDAWAYYFGASYALNSAHRFELYAIGAPQRHGQMRYKQNIGVFDTDFAKSLDDYDEAALDVYGEVGNKDRISDSDYDDFESGRFYNENWNTVDSDYDGKQYYYMYGAKTIDRHDPDYLNESENYYHKPIVNFNHYWTINDAMRLSSTFYFSGGSGGGTGTFDDMLWTSNPSRIADWDGTIAINQGTVNRKGGDKAAGQSVGFLRNSYNRQWTLGAISKLNYDLSEDLKVQVGVDWRTAEIEHGREVRDLLGGTYAVNADYDPYSSSYGFFYNEFAPDEASAKVGLGDIINYHNNNTVDWLGFFAQGEYNLNRFSLYGMGGFSFIKYGLVDHFKKASNYTDRSYVTASDDGELMIEADAVMSFQVKGGGLYHVNETTDVFANFGYVEKPPILDNIIDDVEISLSEDPANETFISGEVGANLRLMNGRLNTKLNAYYTMWRDRTVTRNVLSGTGSSGDTDIIFLTGMDQDHLGVEAEIAFQPIDLVRFDLALSYGLWDYSGDADGTYKNIAQQTTEDYLYSIDGLKIGDMPQTIVALGASVFPIDGMNIQAVFNYYDRHWADWDPQSRQVDAGDDPDREDSWQIPSAYKIDLHATYNLPFDLNGIKFQVFAHVFNALDEIYVQDATDNSSYNAYDSGYPDYDKVNPHKADAAEVYLSTPRYWNVGLKINF